MQRPYVTLRICNNVIDCGFNIVSIIYLFIDQCRTWLTCT